MIHPTSPPSPSSTRCCEACTSSSLSDETDQRPRTPPPPPPPSGDKSDRSGDHQGYPYSPYRALRRTPSSSPTSPVSVVKSPFAQYYRTASAFASTAKVGGRVSMNGIVMTGGRPPGSPGSASGRAELGGMNGGPTGAAAGPSSPISLRGMNEAEGEDLAALRKRILELESAFSSQHTYIHMLETSLRSSSASLSSSAKSYRSSSTHPAQTSDYPASPNTNPNPYPPSLSRRASSRIPIPAAGLMAPSFPTVSASSSSASTNTLRAAMTHSAPIYDLRGTVEGQDQSGVVAPGESGLGVGLGEAIDLGDSPTGTDDGLGSGPGAGSMRNLGGSRSELEMGRYGSTHGNENGRMSPVPGSPALAQGGEGHVMEEGSSPTRAGSSSSKRAGVDKRNSAKLGLSLIPRSRVQSAVSHIDQPTASSTARRASVTPSNTPRPSSRSSSRASHRAETPVQGEPSPSTGSASGLTSPINLHPNSAKVSPFGTIAGFGGPSSPSELNNGHNLASGSGSGRPANIRKASSAMGSSGKVIENLTREVESTKTHLERVKAELRQSQRLIGQFTRQTADLQETKDRMRIEAEGLNNVIARKERLLDEVLVRARRAENELAIQTKERKALEASTKRQIDQMTAELDESQTRSKKSEREAIALKDGFKGMKDSWAREIKAVRADVKANADAHKAELEEARRKHAEVSGSLATASETQKSTVEALQEERRQLSSEVSTALSPHVDAIKRAMDAEEKELVKLRDEIAFVTGEMSRIKRLMRGAP